MPKPGTEKRENVVKWYGDSPAIFQVEVRPGIYNEHRHDSLHTALMQALVCKHLNWIIQIRAKTTQHIQTYVLRSSDPDTFTVESKLNPADEPESRLMGRNRGLFND